MNFPHPSSARLASLLLAGVVAGFFVPTGPSAEHRARAADRTVNIALEVVKTCLAHLLASNEGQERMRRMIPTFDHDLKQPRNAALFEKTSREATERLHLTGQADHNSTTLPTRSHHHEQL